MTNTVFYLLTFNIETIFEKKINDLLLLIINYYFTNECFLHN